MLLTIIACFGLFLAVKWNARSAMVVFTLFIFGELSAIFFPNFKFDRNLARDVVLSSGLFISVLFASFWLFRYLGDPRFEIFAGQMSMSWHQFLVGGMVNWSIDVGSDNPHNTLLFYQIVFGIFGIVLIFTQSYFTWVSTNLFQSMATFFLMQTETITLTPYAAIWLLPGILFIKNKKNK
jgi:hypothetical protein